MKIPTFNPWAAKMKKDLEQKIDQKEEGIEAVQETSGEMQEDERSQKEDEKVEREQEAFEQLQKDAYVNQQQSGQKLENIREAITQQPGLEATEQGAQNLRVGSVQDKKVAVAAARARKPRSSYWDKPAKEEKKGETEGEKQRKKYWG